MTKSAYQARRLLALAEIDDAGSRSAAARIDEVCAISRQGLGQLAASGS